MNVVLAVALLTQTPGGPEPLPRRIWRSLRDHLRDAEDEADVRTTCARVLDAADTAEVEARLERLHVVGEWLSNLRETGIRALSEFDDEYPARWRERLGGQTPPVCFVAGEASSSSGPAIAIVGSRDAPEDCLAFAETVGSVCARRGYGVVSGGARGVDALAMNAAFESGGRAIGILADSMLKAARTQVDRLLTGRWLLLSPFSPEASFSVGGAMGRNKLVYALADAALVVHSAHGTGGTWAGAEEALKEGFCPVATYVGGAEADGARALERKGAHPVVHVEDVFRLIGSQGRVQPKLFP